MKKTNFMLGVLLAVIALMMIISPEQCIMVAVIALGIEAIINGIFNLIKVRQLVDDKSFQLIIIIRSAFSIIIGTIAIFVPLKFAGIMWTAMLYVLSSYLLIAAVLQIYAIAKLRDTSIERRQYVIEVIVSVVGSVILFIMPQKIGLALVRVLGIILLLVSAGYILFDWYNRPIVVDDVEVVDDIQSIISDVSDKDSEEKNT